MTPRALLVRGLVAGLLAGFATFLVAYTVGEPSVEKAIALEQAGPTAVGKEHVHVHDGVEETRASGNSQGEGGTEVSRHTQRVWGLLTGALTVSIALGGLTALLCGAAIGRIGTLSPAQTTAVVTLSAFVSFALVPFLKYPSIPPGVGSGDTIGSRTALYFGFVFVSLTMAVAAVQLGRIIYVRTKRAYPASLAAPVAYVVAMAVAGLLFSRVNEIGDFPGDLLWDFRRASLLTLTTQWAVIGAVLVGALTRLQKDLATAQRRRELAAAL